MRWWLHRGVALVLVGVLVGASACSGSKTSASTVPPPSVSVNPSPTTVSIDPASPIRVAMAPKAELRGNVLGRIRHDESPRRIRDLLEGGA